MENAQERIEQARAKREAVLQGERLREEKEQTEKAYQNAQATEKNKTAGMGQTRKTTRVTGGETAPKYQQTGIPTPDNPKRNG